MMVIKIDKGGKIINDTQSLPQVALGKWERQAGIWKNLIVCDKCCDGRKPKY